ncbi:MAG: 16S rRNA (cytidine(1402)-2'-O)-methyltransferase [Desulfobulbus sp.]|jgi:16S rRNA (cytidine1402-2'-O)-methyltransferase
MHIPHFHPDYENPGTLYIVATPIGNLGDISQRALDILTTVDTIACEDTRHTKKLCRHFGINTPLVSYYREKEQEKAAVLLRLLQAGNCIALVSDAGTPTLSDPGAVLVRQARQAGIPIVAIPGPSALTAALSIAGLAETSFFFGGFLPAASAERRKLLRTIASLPHPLIFYESPHRIHAALADLQASLGDRRIQLFRELTKIHEECLEDTLSGLHQTLPQEVKGELVLIVEGAAPPAAMQPEEMEELLRWYRDRLNSTLKEAVQRVSADLDLPRSQVYKKALSLWNDR